MGTDQQVQEGDARIDDPHVKGYGGITPYKWKTIAAMAATALAQIAVEMRRIADVMETPKETER